MRRATRTMPALLLFISELRPPVIDGARLLAEYFNFEREPMASRSAQVLSAGHIVYPCPQGCRRRMGDQFAGDECNSPETGSRCMNLRPHPGIGLTQNSVRHFSLDLGSFLYGLNSTCAAESRRYRLRRRTIGHQSYRNISIGLQFATHPKIIKLSAPARRPRW